MSKKLTKIPSNHPTRDPLDRRLFALDDVQHAAFLKALDEPVAPNARLKRLMASKSPWEK